MEDTSGKKHEDDEDKLEKIIEETLNQVKKDLRQVKEKRSSAKPSAQRKQYVSVDSHSQFLIDREFLRVYSN